MGMVMDADTGRAGADGMKAEPIEIENPYEDYETYEVTVVEMVKKVFRCWAKDAESAEEYVHIGLMDIDMERNIDKYDRYIETVEKCDPGTCDFTVPLSWYEEDEDE